MQKTDHNEERPQVEVVPESLPGPWSDPLPPTIPESPPGDPETWPFPPPVPEPEPMPEPVPTAGANKRRVCQGFLTRIGAAAPGWRKAQPLPEVQPLPRCREAQALPRGNYHDR